MNISSFSKIQMRQMYYKNLNFYFKLGKNVKMLLLFWLLIIFRDFSLRILNKIINKMIHFYYFDSLPCVIRCCWNIDTIDTCPTSGTEVTLKTGRREVPGYNPGCACRPSRSEFSVVFSEIRVNTGYDPLERPPRRVIHL